MLAIIAGLQYRLWFSDNGIPENQKLEQLIAQQIEENIELKERNDTLWLTNIGLLNDDFYLEGHVRRTLGMIKDGETLFLVFDDLVEEGEAPATTWKAQDIDPNYQFPALPDPEEDSQNNNVEVTENE